MTGTIVKSLSGFYCVDVGQGEPILCRGRGRLRHQRITPLVGDRAEITLLPDGSGAVDEILPRKNQFSRPMVANIDQLIMIASGAIPVTDPYLIDRMAAMAETKGCNPVICFNKCDLAPADELAAVYRKAGFLVFQVSAKTGAGIHELGAALSGKVSAFTGNSGVGKSSILNALAPGFALQVGEVSQKLGRGRHTTRHVELFRLCGGLAADTPGFSAFDAEGMEQLDQDQIAAAFRDFTPYLDRCRFTGCAHGREKGCAVRAAVEAGEIAASRYESYLRLFQQAKEQQSW